MKLTTTTWVTLDGVMQGLGADSEDRRGGFERGGWAMAYFDADARDALGGIYARADAFLFGRRTYEIFAGSWGTWDDPGGDNRIWASLNRQQKYVVSSSLSDPRWADTTVLSGELTSAIGELKQRPGGEVQVHGSGALVRSLLAAGLVDELNLFVVPAVVGQGTRLFPDTGPDQAFALDASRTTAGGTTIQTYRPDGRPQYATADA